MTTFSTDSSNDLHLDQNGQIAISSGRNAYGEIITAAIRTLVGELQLDIERGVPYLSTSFGGNIAGWKASVRNIINRYDFVNSIESFNYTIDGNVLNYKIVIDTDDGEVTVEG